ncbi:MAG: helix-turn-helix transcriptional regulator [Lachnospiraceae bacterium]|nr:helix-turn-helix transcriptional regulator [Lachnospiraceae bacterium]
MEKKRNDHWDRYREIGYRISYCRKHRKMTQEEMAEKLDVSRQHIGAIEAPNVNRKISMDLMFDIADLLDVDPKYFLEYQEIPLASEEKQKTGKAKNKK